MLLVSTHKDLIVWRKAVTLASRIHELTAGFSSRDSQTLSARMCHCAVALVGNIAEGAAHGNRTEYIRFLSVARGLLSELEAQVCICVELKIIDAEVGLQALIVEVGDQLDALIRRLREHRERARGFDHPRRLANH